ncbi:MAG: hypothetical protein ABFR47_01200 [Verrucomicrobiota bacterium]
MSEEKVFIYISPSADINAYPDNLQGDMSVFRQARSIQHEVQWIFYLMLKDQGLDVSICHDFPDRGILLIHKSHVKKFAWNPNLFVVSLQWDYKRDDRAQMHLVSNNYKTTKASLGWLDRLSFQGLQHYVPPIMHPVIIPHDAEREDQIEKIAFIGDPKNLDEAFKTGAFESAVQQLGMEFIVRSDPDKMADFSDIDVVMAIRKIGQIISNKPPTKLINSWRGGVPAILGCELGFREARETEYDYIEVDSVEDVLNALSRLKDDVEFRHEMIANAKRRGAPFSAEGQQQIWVEFFKNTIIPAYHDWQCRPAVGKFAFLLLRGIRYWMRESLSFIWHHVLRRRSSDYS